MKVSVIIPVFNEENHIIACLNSIKNQTHTDLEIIVVDDGSTDRTVKRVKQFRHAKLFHQHHLGPATARNRGAIHAKGDILVFVDADMVCEQNFVKNLIKPILTGSSIGTFTKDEIVANWENRWSRMWNLETTGSTTHFRLPKKFPNISPVFRAIKKVDFDRVGGFDPIGYTDDWTLSEKLKTKATVSPNAIVYHKNPDSLSSIFKQASWIGKRRYKLWEIGRLWALIRASFPISFIFATIGAVRYRLPYYLIFKLTYDFGIVLGIVTYWLKRKHAR